MPKENLLSLAEAKASIQDADLLLFRGKGIVSRFIRTFGRGKYSHAAKASWIKGELFCLEVREWRGGRAVTLSSQVQKFPGQIDVFETNAIKLPDYNRVKADDLMLRFAGIEYGYWDIIGTAFLHAWGIRLIAQANVDDEFVSKRPPYCSAACAIADRVGGGVDPVPNLADKITEPSDLARSQLYKYRCTLMPDDETKTRGGDGNEASEMMAEQTASAPPVTVTEAVAEQDSKKN